jgi:hypothetical protein
MGDAIAHLPGADHPHILNIQRHVFLSDRCEDPALGFGFGI